MLRLSARNSIRSSQSAGRSVEVAGRRFTASFWWTDLPLRWVPSVDGSVGRAHGWGARRPSGHPVGALAKLDPHGPQSGNGTAIRTLSEEGAGLGRGCGHRIPCCGVRIVEFFDLDNNGSEVRVRNDGHHVATPSVHDHDCCGHSRPVHPGHDSGLRVLFAFAEHQL